MRHGVFIDMMDWFICLFMRIGQQEKCIEGYALDGSGNNAEFGIEKMEGVVTPVASWKRYWSAISWGRTGVGYGLST